MNIPCERPIRCFKAAKNNKMPTINIKADWSRGPIFPVRISTGNNGSIRTMAAVSLSHWECLISPRLTEQLGSLSIGMATPLSYISRGHASPAHKVQLEFVAGGLGRPVFRHCLYNVIAVEASLSVGFVVGCQVLSKGNASINRQVFAFCL